MKAVDTNILVRFLVRDDEGQAAKVLDRLRLAESGGEVLYVPLVVMLETIWVLESVYDIPRDEVVVSIAQLMQIPIFEFDGLSALRGMVHDAGKTSVGLADLLIGHAARSAGCDTVLTLDRRAARTDLFEAIG